ncbi:MAG: pilin biogenesis protein [Pseudoalteromonas sp.]|uniref:PilC/PilY family type IV pilus protein n=1 Tax=Pseudoalteromonas sp. TaxID=53249 RepID=UPI0025E00623|nr:PilC/PilY family type IV pilus protein [Pseudoalteromonas sp.]MCH2089510.1 pilin biogenesis protein [Pseudoalteromonas sp.]
MRKLNLLCQLSVISFLFIGCSGYADDTELYVNYDHDLKEKQRVIFLLDTSGSMLFSATDGSRCHHPTGGYLVECPESRIAAARDIIIETIENNSDMDFGFNRFAPSHGGYVKASLGTEHNTLKNLIRGIKAGGSTPVTESLWEVYMYLTGQKVDFGSLVAVDERDTKAEIGKKYLSPFDTKLTGDKRCDNTVNVLLITDGEPQNDNERDADIEKLNQFYFSEPAPLYGYEHNLNYLAALAKVIHGTDEVIVDLNKKTPKIHDQGIIYTIGFGNGLSEPAKDLLEKTAELGGGKYFFASDGKALSEKLKETFAVLRNESGTFTAPSTASNNADQTRSRDGLYYTMFYPSTNARWRGNLKKLKVSGDIIVDANGQSAIQSDGLIAKEAKTFWSNSDLPDGNAVELGGVNSYLANISSLPNTGRKVLTNLSGGRLLNFTRYRVVFHYNTIAKAAVDFESSPDEVEDLINWSRGLDVNDEDNDGETDDSRQDIFGDPLHSKPVTIDYGNDDVRILIGTNAGYLHMFQDKNDVLAESWAFIPRSLYKIIKPLRDNTQDTKVYGVDGAISVFFDDKNGDGVVNSSDRVWAFFGLRRGGNEYYALDITNPNQPKLLWKEPLKGGVGDFKELAQSWSKPEVAYINLNGFKDRPVLIFGAGYDTNKDNVLRSDDNKGRGIYIVDAETGEKVWGLTPDENDFTGEHSIASDISLLDSDYDGYIDRLYATDTGGNIWRIDMPSDNPKDSEQPWTHFKLASLGSQLASNDRRFFYKPTVARTVFSKVSKTIVNGKSETTRIDFPYDAILVGSGNRAKPTSTLANDQLFMIRDSNTVTKSFKGNDVPDVIFQSNLMNVDSDPFGSALKDIDAFVDLEVELGKFKGWYYNLSSAGEKSLAASTVIGGVAYYTSFSPASDDSTENQCSLSAGTGSLYAFHLHYGTKVYENLKFITGTDVPDTPKLFFGETESCKDTNGDGYCDGYDDDSEDKIEQTKISQFMTVGPKIIGEESPFKVKGVNGPGLTIENGEIKLVSDEPLGFKVQQTYIYKKEENDRSY